jgi:hypothetical protein
VRNHICVKKLNCSLKPAMSGRLCSLCSSFPSVRRVSRYAQGLGVDSLIIMDDKKGSMARLIEDGGLLIFCNIWNKD